MFTYFAIAIWGGFASPFSPGSRHKSERALGIAIITIIVGWMDCNAVSQTFISTPRGREGADITEGRLRGEERRRGVISCDWGAL